MTESTENRVVVTWEGPDGEAVALPLLPKRALTLAQELLTRGVQAIKADPEAPWEHPIQGQRNVRSLVLSRHTGDIALTSESSQ